MPPLLDHDTTTVAGDEWSVVSNGGRGGQDARRMRSRRGSRSETGRKPGAPVRDDTKPQKSIGKSSRARRNGGNM